MYLPFFPDILKASDRQLMHLRGVQCTAQYHPMSSARILLSWSWFLTTSGSRSTLSDLASSWHSESALSCSPQQWGRCLLEKPLFIVSVHCFCVLVSAMAWSWQLQQKQESPLEGCFSRPLPLHSLLGMKLLPCKSLSTAGLCRGLWPAVSPHTSSAHPVRCNKIWVCPRVICPSWQARWHPWWH